MHNELAEALTFRESGQYQEAQNWLNNFLISNPTHPEAWSLLSQILMLNKNDDAAEEALLKALTFNPELRSVHRNHARLLLKQSKPDKALEVVSVASLQSSSDPEDWLVIATCLGSNQKEREALLFLNKAINTHPNYAEAYANRAVLRLRAKDIEGAIGDAAKAVAIKPHMSQIWALLGYLNHQINNLPGAINALKNAHQLEPTNVEHIFNLGEFMRQLGNFIDAISYLKRATEMTPTNVKAWTSLGLAFQQSQKLQEAQIAFEKALKHSPDIAELHFNLGFVHLHQDRLNEAKACFLQAIKLDPRHLQAHLNLGNTLGKQSQLEAAEVCYRNVITLDPEHVEALNNLGNMLKNKNKLDEAVINYRKALEFAPNYAEIHNNLGTTFKAQGKLQQAIVSFKRALEITPNSAEVYNNMGSTLKELGDFIEAETHIKQAIKLRPDNADLYGNLANVLRELGRLDESESNYRKAIQLEPNNSNACFSLGSLLLKIKEYSQAIKYFQLSNNPESSFFLLRCFYLLDRESEFYELLDYSIKQNEIHPMLGSIGCRAALKFGIEKPNLFCKSPFEYVLKIDLKQHYDFKHAIVSNTKIILNQNRIAKKRQSLLKNGFQTYGNLFDIEPELTKEIQAIIHSEIEKYRTHFQGSHEGLITHWPTNYRLYGWLVSMQSGGELTAHMHERGWISGSIYINVPPKLNVDSGNLVVCLGDGTTSNESNIQKQSLDVVTGSMCLFPASLHHYTIPFNAKEERIVLAFDVVPSS